MEKWAIKHANTVSFFLKDVIENERKGIFAIYNIKYYHQL